MLSRLFFQSYFGVPRAIFRSPRKFAYVQKNIPVLKIHNFKFSYTIEVEIEIPVRFLSLHRVTLRIVPYVVIFPENYSKFKTLRFCSHFR